MMHTNAESDSLPAGTLDDLLDPKLNHDLGLDHTTQLLQTTQSDPLSMFNLWMQNSALSTLDPNLHNNARTDDSLGDSLLNECSASNLRSNKRKDPCSSSTDHELGPLFQRRLKSKMKGHQHQSSPCNSHYRLCVGAADNKGRDATATVDVGNDQSFFRSFPEDSREAGGTMSAQENVFMTKEAIPFVNSFAMSGSIFHRQESLGRSEIGGKLQEECQQEMMQGDYVSPRNLTRKEETRNLNRKRLERHNEADISPSDEDSSMQDTPQKAKIRKIPMPRPSSGIQGKESSEIVSRYVCPHTDCVRNFSTSGHARRHSRIHYPARPHKCGHKDCPATFTRKDNCQQHERTRHRSR